MGRKQETEKKKRVRGGDADEGNKVEKVSLQTSQVLVILQQICQRTRHLLVVFHF